MGKPRYEPGWTIPHHGNYCDHYATAIDDPNTCGRCGATRLVEDGTVDTHTREPMYQSHDEALRIAHSRCVGPAYAAALDRD